MAGLAENVTILMPKKKVGSQAASAEKKKLRVAAYARVSTDNEEQEGSYENVFYYYERYYNEHGIPLNIQILDMQELLAV